MLDNRAQAIPTRLHHSLIRIGVSDTSQCECEKADQTPNHVLQSCPKYAERCQLTWPQDADLATKLWGLAEDLYRTAGFVASTELQIWPAWLSIAEEEQEESLLDVPDLISFRLGIFISTTASDSLILLWMTLTFDIALNDLDLHSNHKGTKKGKAIVTVSYRREITAKGRFVNRTASIDCLSICSFFICWYLFWDHWWYVCTCVPFIAVYFYLNLCYE